MPSNSDAKPLKKRVSIACVKCRDRKVKVRLCGLTLNRLLSFSSLKCIPAAQEEPRCARCIEKNHHCQYMTVTAQTEQRERQTTPEPTDYYPHYGSSPVHPPPATSAYSQPPPATSAYSQPSPATSAYSQPPPATSAYSQPPPATSAYSQPLPATSAYSQPPPSVAPAYSYPQQSFSNQPYPTSAYQVADHQNAPSPGFSPPSNISQPFSYGPPPQAFSHAQQSSPIRSGQGTSGNGVHQNTPPHSFSPPMSSGHQAYSYAPPRQAFPHAQSSSTIRSAQDTSGNHVAHTYFDSTYQGSSTTK